MGRAGLSDGFSFEDFYAAAGDDWGRIPWAHLRPRPFLVDWLDRNPPAPGTSALVVACGFGDDAEELAARGCAVQAFDVAPTAIEVARRRFPETAVTYRVADLFALPEEWTHAFELVVEVQTVQSLPPARHREAIEVIAGLVAPGGHLLFRASLRGEDEPSDSIPWPLKPSEVAWLTGCGLREVSAEMDGSFLHADYRREGGARDD